MDRVGSFKVKNLFAHDPFFQPLCPPKEPDRKNAPIKERFLDSVLSNLDMLEFPPLFSWSSPDEKEMNKVFFKILAEDLLAAEAFFEENHEDQKSWKWEAVERLSYQLLRVFHQIHKGNCPPLIEPEVPSRPAELPQIPLQEPSRNEQQVQVESTPSEEVSSETSPDVEQDTETPQTTPPASPDSRDEDEQPALQFSSVSKFTSAWKRFNRRSIHTKAQFFQRQTNPLFTTIDDVSQKFFKEIDRLALIWAAKESQISSHVWKLPSTRKKRKKQVEKTLTKFSPLEKFELLRRAVHLFPGTRGQKAIALFTDSFLQSYVKMDEHERSFILQAIEQDEKLHTLREKLA